MITDPTYQTPKIYIHGAKELQLPCYLTRAGRHVGGAEVDSSFSP